MHENCFERLADNKQESRVLHNEPHLSFCSLIWGTVSHVGDDHTVLIDMAVILAQGIHVCVLEASDRVGGRTYSVEMSSQRTLET